MNTRLLSRWTLRLPREPRVLYDEPRIGSMGSRITFLHPKDCHGVLTELVTSATEPSQDH